MKRVLGIILAVVILIAVCGGIAAASILGQGEQDYGEFIPVVRFAVASDTHVDDKGTELFEQRLEKLFSSAYAYAGSQQYSALDGVFITGDFTDNGTLSSMQKVFGIIDKSIQEGTVCRVTLGNHDFYTDKENSLDTFLKASEYETVNAHFTLKGFHFICINPDLDGLNFSEEAVSWLDEQLAQAAAEDPTGKKPIFVFQHEPAYDTVVHSLKLGVEELLPVLEKYPQVVDFSGHTHCPTSDPRNIWQGAFTAVGVGPLCHFEYTIASQEEEISAHTNHEGDYGIWPSVNDASQYYIVEVNANNAVRLLRYDVDTDRLLEDPVILTNIGHGAWPLPEFLQKLLSEQPVFAEDAKAEAVFTTSSSVQIRFPQAKCGDTVHYYSVELYQDGEELDFQYRMACSFLDEMPQTLTATFIGLEPDTQYTVKIFARNPWGKESEPCVLDFRTEAAVSGGSDADVLDMKLQGEDVAFNAVTGEIFSRVGQPKVEFDSELGYEVLVLDGKSGYLMDGFADFYDRLTDGVSLEVYLKLDTTVSKTENNWVSPLSNLQRSGVGMEISFHGHPSFQGFINDDYGIAEAPEPIPVGEYVHIIGTYDGAYVRLYVNGKEVAADQRPGGVSYGISGYESADYMGIGMDADPARMAQSCITGRLALARIYSSVLTPEQVQQRFAACAGIGEE